MKYSRTRRTGMETLEQRNLLTTLADIDSDGDLDVVTNTAWLENIDGYGNFVDHSFQTTSAAQVGDLDGDGDLDVATSNAWLENTDGKGDFEVLRELPIPGDFPARRGVKLLDVGGDGDLDIAMHNGNRALHFENIDGRGQFRLGSDIALAGMRDHGDVDNDGLLDALTLEDGGIFIYRNTGNGEFQKTLWHQAENPADHPGFEVEIPQTFSVELLDINSDGWLDVASRSGADGFYWLWGRFNDRAGNVADSEVLMSCFGGCTFQFDDFDQDGDPDLLYEEYPVDHTFVYENRGAGGFRYVGSTFSALAEIISAGDINGDGVIDFLKRTTEWIDGATDTVHIPGTKIDLPPPFTHTFVKQTLAVTEPIATSAVADLNNDGHLDIIAGDWNSIDWYENGRDCHVIAEPVRSGVQRLEAVDMDNDSDIDIVYSNYRSIFWIENLGDGRFAERRLLNIFDRLYSWHLADINQDGHTDLVATTRGAGVFGGSEIFLAIDWSGGLFIAVPVESSGKTILGSVVADVDSDQDLDVFAVVGYWQGQFDRRVHEIVWFENRDGELQPERLIGPSTIPYRSLHSADLNGDGQVDLIASDDSGIVWFDAFFGERRSITADGGSTVLTSDVDNDGDLDIVSTSGQQIVWFENQNGQGDFEPARRIGHSLDPTRIHSADFDGDGDTDVINTSGNGEIILFESRVTGDSNNDGVFNSGDLVIVFQQGEYEDGAYRNSTFATGDWNGDREFGSQDLIFAFQAGTYSANTARRQVAAAVTIDLLFQQVDKNAAAGGLEWMAS